MGVLGDGCFFLDQVTDNLSQQFSTLAGSIGAAGETVLINFADTYNDSGSPNAIGYRPKFADSTYFTQVFNTIEELESCTPLTACFANVGVDSALPAPPLPTPTPTPTPVGTPTPTPDGTPTPTPTGGGGGTTSGSCNTLVGPVQVGSAMANVLIPLIPVAFAFGVRAIRRRKK